MEVVFVVPVPLKLPVQSHPDPLQPDAVNVTVVPTQAVDGLTLNDGAEGVLAMVTDTPLLLLSPHAADVVTA